MIENHFSPDSALPASSGAGNFEPLINAQEAALLLGCHPRTLLRKAREGVIPAIRVFDKVRFRASALNDWLESQGYNPSTVRAA